MGAIQQLGAETWRDYETDGVPASGPHPVLKSDARAFAAVVDAGVAAVASALASANAVVFSTQAALYADTAPAAGTLGLVYGDTVANNGFYVKAGAAGVAGWTYTGAGPAGPPGASGNNGALISQTGQQLVAGMLYGVETSLGAMNATLPPLGVVQNGEIVEVEDVDFDAATNPFTVNAHAGDQIKFEGAAATAVFVINTNGSVVRFRKNNGIWRARFYA